MLSYFFRDLLVINSPAVIIQPLEGSDVLEMPDAEIEYPDTRGGQLMRHQYLA